VDIVATGGSLLAWLFVGLLLILSQALECLAYALSIHTASTAAPRPTPSSAETHGRPIIPMCLAILVRLVSMFAVFLLMLTEADEQASHCLTNGHPSRLLPRLRLAITTCTTQRAISACVSHLSRLHSYLCMYVFLFSCRDLSQRQVSVFGAQWKLHCFHTRSMSSFLLCTAHLICPLTNECVANLGKHL
jgi:hypothetical protein